jgi:hypothetical protein
MEKQIEKGGKNLRGLCRDESGAASVLCEIFHKVADLGEFRCALEKKIGPISSIGPISCLNYKVSIRDRPERASWRLSFLRPFSQVSLIFQLSRPWLFPHRFHLRRCCE